MSQWCSGHTVLTVNIHVRFILFHAHFRLGFKMDDVSSVTTLPDKISLMNYYPDPDIQNFTEIKKYQQVLIINVSTSNLTRTV